MPADPPPFQETPRCDVCKCSFNTFRRQHHCGCCGRTLCHEHSSNLMNAKAGPHPSLGEVDSMTNDISSLNINAVVDSKTEATVKHQPVTSIPYCKCGMPLCFYESLAPTSDALPVKADEKPSILDGVVKSKIKKH